jgi:ribosome-associated translation inhibitor RaiA
LHLYNREKNGMVMETPAQIDFQGMSASDHARDEIAAQIATLEERFGRVTACRVVVKAPSGRHKNGGQYEINVRLTLPNNREVNIGRTATQDERHADLDFALNDAFKRARRQLQDEVDLMRGHVKTRA